MLKLRIDGKDICELSDDQIGATLQQIARELAARRCPRLSEQVDTIGTEMRAGIDGTLNRGKW